MVHRNLIWLSFAGLILFLQCSAPLRQTGLLEPGKSKSDGKHYLALEFFILGNRYFYQGCPDLAVEAYQKALSYEADNAYLCEFAASRALDAGRMDMAFQWLRRRNPALRSSGEWKLLGQIYLQKKKPLAAREAFEKSLSRNDQDADVHYLLGVLDEASGKIPQSIEAFRKAGRLKGNPWDAEERAALLYLQAKMLDSAENILLRLSQQDSGEARVLRTLAVVYETAGKDSAAEQAYRIILSRNSDDDAARLSLGNLLLRQGRWKESMIHYRALVQKYPKKISYLKTLGVLYLEADSLDSAQAVFLRLASLAAEDSEGHYYLGNVYLEKSGSLPEKDSLEARELLELSLIEFNKAIALQKDYTEAWIQLGITHLRLRDAAGAIRVFAEAAKRFAAMDQIRFLLGIAYEAGNQREQAVAAFEAALEINPQNKKALFELGAALEQSGKTDKASAIFERLIVQDPKHALALNYLGYMWADKGIRLPEAESYILRALEVEPENPAYIDSYGWVLFRKKELDEAEKWIKKAIEKMSPADPVLYDHLGDIYKAQNRTEEARTYWKKALDVDSENQAIRKKLDADSSTLQHPKTGGTR